MIVSTSYDVLIVSTTGMGASDRKPYLGYDDSKTNRTSAPWRFEDKRQLRHGKCLSRQCCFLMRTVSDALRVTARSSRSAVILATYIGRQRDDSEQS